MAIAELHGGWPTTKDKATGFVPALMNPGTEDETQVLIPITTNPIDALPIAPQPAQTGTAAPEAIVPAATPA